MWRSRRLHHQYFTGVDSYYMPFLSPTVHRTLTHREDREALEQYRAYQQMYRRIAEAQGRPLTHMSPGKGDEYQWLDDPWPWEFAANKEV